MIKNVPKKDEAEPLVCTVVRIQGSEGSKQMYDPQNIRDSSME